MKIKLQNDCLTFNLDKSIYSINILYKCLYLYNDNYSVDIISNNKNNWTIYLYPIKIKIIDIDINKLENQIRNDLIDFKLRDIITNETLKIRESIIAQAFSNK